MRARDAWHTTDEVVRLIHFEDYNLLKPRRRLRVAAATAPLPWVWDGVDLRGRRALEVPSSPAVPYPRIFMDRVPFPQGLSVLDALFHLGPAVGDVLSQHGASHDAVRADSPAR